MKKYDSCLPNRPSVVAGLFIMLSAISMAVPAQGTSSKLEEVVVTAQKVTENLQDAAISVTALSGDNIERSGIKDPIEMESRLPSVKFQVANTPVIVIRGVGTYNNQPGVDSAVAYTVDGTYLSHHPALMPVMFDINRVEAVRGPQGTLYGRNSNGGALNITTNKPVLDEYQASAAVTLGNYSAVGTELMGNAPLGDGIAIRAAVASDSHNPYFDDGSQGANNYAGRVRLLIAPSEDFDFLATVDYARKFHQGQGSSYCPPNSAYAACQGFNADPYDGYVGNTGDLSKAVFRIKNFGAYAEMNYRMDWGTLTSITNYRKYELENTWIWDFVEYRPDNDNKFFTQEIRLASPRGAPFEWVIGGFYSRESLNAIEAYDFFGIPSLDFRFDDGNMSSKAIFGQVTWPVTTGLRVTGGLRYTAEKKSMFGSATTYDLTGTIPTTVDTGAVNDEKKLTWKIGADFDLSPDSLLYASVSTGFKSGGVNQVPPGVGLSEVYEPEEIIAYQAGSKNRFMNDRLQINGEIFYYDYEGYQQYSQEADPTGTFPAVFFITVASQEATFYGGEIEASMLVSDAGKLDLYATFLHAKFDEFVVGAINNTGNEVQGAPDFTLGGAYEHTFHLNSGGEVNARINTQFVDGHYVANNNAPGSFQDSYTRTGINVSYLTPGRSWRVTAFVRNLEDEAVMASYADPISRGGDIGFLEAPRTWGVTVQWTMP